MKVESINTNKIKTASYNPTWRNTKRLNSLSKSISEYGIIEPLLLTQDLDLVDGHRRLAVAKILGLKDVPCILKNGTTKQLRDTIYLEVNQNSLKLNGADQVEIYKKGGKIEKKYLNPLLSLIEICGTKIIDLLIDRRQNPYALHGAYARLRKYIGVKNINSVGVKKTILWLNHHKQIFAVRRAIEARTSPKVILNAIIKNRPLKRTWG